jgi:hypothetical protein
MECFGKGPSNAGGTAGDQDGVVGNLHAFTV